MTLRRPIDRQGRGRFPSRLLGPIRVRQGFSASIFGRAVAGPMDLSFSADILSWHRADLGLTTGGTMSWADQSGNGHTYSRTSNQPTVEATGWNSLYQTLLFDGTNDGMECTTALAQNIVGGSDNSFAIITIAQFVAIAAAATPVLWGLTSSTDSDFFCHMSARGSGVANPNIFRGAKEDTVPLLATTDSTEAPDTNRRIYRVSHTGTVLSMSRDGVALTMSGGGAQDVGTMTVDRATLGMLKRAGSETNYANIRIAEQICKASPFTADNLSEINTLYLTPRYGLSA